MNQAATRGYDDAQPPPVGPADGLPLAMVRLPGPSRALEHLFGRLPAHLTVELCTPSTEGGALMTTIGAMTTRGAGSATGMTSIDEIRAFRARLLYDSGRRPAFRSASGDYVDPDPVDERAYHVVARDGSGELVGCVRLVKAELVRASAVEAHLGYERAARLLGELAVPRSRILEVGRLVVTVRRRGQSLTPVMLIGCVALSRQLGRPVLWAVCGTRDRQHRLFERMGSRMLPDSTAYVPKYDDELCVHILDQRDPDPAFGAVSASVDAFSFQEGG